MKRAWVSNIVLLCLYVPYMIWGVRLLIEPDIFGRIFVAFIMLMTTWIVLSVQLDMIGVYRDRLKKRK